MANFHRFIPLAALLVSATCLPAQTTGPILSVTFQQGGRGTTVNSGGSVSMIAPGVGRATTGIVTITYLGATKLTFPSEPEVIGSTDFSVQAPSPMPVLTSLQAVSFNVQFKPSTGQAASALIALRFQDATTNGLFTLNLTGTVSSVIVSYLLPSTPSAIPLANGDTVPFGQSALFSAKDITVLISNRGSATSQINSILVIGESFQPIGIPALPLTLPAGAQIQMAIRFLPQTPGPATGSLQVSFDDTILSATLSGTAFSSVFSYSLAKDQTVTPLAPNQTIELGDVKVGENTSVVVRFRNTLAVPATLNLIAISGAGLSFSEGPILPVILQPGQESSVRVRFAPQTQGAVTGRLAIGTDSFPITARAIGAQLQLSYEIGGVTQRLGSSDVAAFPATGIGRTVSARFSLLNQGTGPFSLFSLAVTDPSASFQLSGPPATPMQLQPGETISFTVAFAPKVAGKVTGTLDLNGVAIAGLSAAGSSDATSSPLQFSYVVAGVSSTVGSGSSLNFPSTPLTQTTTSQFTITNPSSEPARIVNIVLDQSRSAFQLAGLPALPVQIAPNQSLSFTIVFRPEAPGSATAILTIDAARFNLSASAPDPADLLGYQFTGASGQQAPFQQAAIGLSLTSPYPLDLKGTLAITTVSDAFAQDPSVRFSSGGQAVAFTIPANTLQARFPGTATQIQLQTGTVAGAILITPSFSVNDIDLTPRNPAALRLEIPKIAPVLLSGSIGSQSATSFSVSIAGYATTRSLQTVNFTFNGENNQALGQVAVDIGGSSRIWFQSAASAPFGGQFSVQMPFALRSSSSTANLVGLVREITVQAVNEQGPSNVIKIPVP